MTRWRPLVQWLLAVPQLMIAYVLRALRQVLTLISFFTVLFTEQVPVRAPGGGLRRFPHRFLPALQLRRLRPRVTSLVGASPHERLNTADTGRGRAARPVFANLAALAVLRSGCGSVGW